MLSAECWVLSSDKGVRRESWLRKVRGHHMPNNGRYTDITNYVVPSFAPPTLQHAISIAFIPSPTILLFLH